MNVQERIAGALGCRPYSDLTAKVYLRMAAGHPDPVATMDDDDFEALAWRAFNSVRRSMLARGLDDPAWDLAVFSEVPVEACGPADGEGANRR